MEVAKPGAVETDVVDLYHWIYGVGEGVGYTTKGVGEGLNVSL